MSLMSETTKASGRNVKESERNTVALKLRLRPETAAEVKRLAKHWDCPASYVVEAMMYIAGRTLEGRQVDEAVEGFEEVLERLYERDE
jgi:hypothetical protein